MNNIDQICFDDSDLDEGTVQMYERRLRNGESLRAVVVRDNNGRLDVIDGFHRIAAMKRYGCEGGSGFYKLTCTPEKAAELRRQLNHREEFN